jgi:imidazoleglycerol-phosphate dehydratase
LSLRKASISRETRETRVSVSLDLDGTGQYQVSTGNGTLDHLLAQLSRHGLLDLTIKAEGDLSTGWHHLVEDTAIALGRALREAVGEGRGIRRMGSAIVPMDEALALVAVDISGRGYAVLEVPWGQGRVDELPADLVRHFLETLALEGRITLHARLLSGVNAHHQAEALFKALARALRQAVELDPRAGGEIPSTKGTITD